MNKFEAAKIIEKHSKEGDVINISNHPAFWKLHIVIAGWGIRRAQKKLFKDAKITLSNGFKFTPNDDTHSMVKFKKETIVKCILNNVKVSDKDKDKVIQIFSKEKYAKTFSVEPPKALYIPTEEYALDDITIYRYKNKELDENDIERILLATLPILLTDYDYGQLMNILVNQTLGYPYDEKVKWFDLGSKRKVCSVGVAVVYQKWRKDIEQIQEFPRLFSKLNKKRWDKEFIKKFEKDGSRWNVENTYPCMFGLTKTHFNNEFELILKMNKGKIQYLKS